MRETISETTVYVGPHYEVRFDKTDVAEDLDDDCRVSVIDIMLVAASSSDPNEIQQIADNWSETCYALAETLKYYSLGGRRVAMRKVPTGTAESLYYLFSDHLGSTSVTYNAATGVTETLRYYPYGGVRGGDSIPTDQPFHRPALGCYNRVVRLSGALL